MKKAPLKNAVIFLAFGINVFVAWIHMLLYLPFTLRMESSLDDKWPERLANITKLFYAIGLYYWLVPFAISAACLLVRKRYFINVVTASLLWPFFWLSFLITVYLITFVTMSGTFSNP